MKTKLIEFKEEELISLKDYIREATFEWIKTKRPDILKRYTTSYFSEENTVESNVIKFQLVIGKEKDENKNN